MIDVFDSDGRLMGQVDPGNLTIPACDLLELERSLQFLESEPLPEDEGDGAR
jgi:hypothetical protein